MATSGIDLLLTRRSVTANKLGEPGPSLTELKQILTAGARVPDHKKLVPWRFVLFQGEARAAFGHVLELACKLEEVDPSPMRLETERGRLLRAPVVIAVVARVIEKPAVPDWEQVLSAGAVCQNLLNASVALGYSANWITEWYAYNTRVREAMGLGPTERVAGFIYIGTAQEPPEERDRPELSDIVTEWKAP